MKGGAGLTGQVEERAMKECSGMIVKEPCRRACGAGLQRQIQCFFTKYEQIRCKIMFMETNNNIII
ncbi:hypothetical protein CDI09_06950 [Komagataeibacter nataicola]|uniref:Uncharacterized protein n=1 Tax=Komagataeibacter nataicola TaxID=265960 RepID=A0ABX5PDR1_9PROT|nr:hypothetical protein CDI09_06950 [Komagataeibacter nataicola]